MVNVVIATAKIAAAFATGSGAMLAEAIHSFADCGNLVLLLVGVKQSKKPADAKHPFGHGRNIYFWSFMVALLLFSGGGVFSVYEGVHKLRHPEPMEHVGWAIGILAFSLVLEGWSVLGNIRDLNKRRGAKKFFRYLQDTTDSDLVVVFGENAAAVLGLIVALSSIGIYQITGAAEAGITALSLVKAGPAAAALRYEVIPAEYHAPLRQRMVLTKQASPAARALYAFIASAEAQAILRASGFESP